MTLSFEVNGVAVPEEAVLIVGSTIGGVQGLPSSAWYGEPSTATIIVDDPFGDYDFRAWEVFTADESAATGKTRVFTGWIFNMTVSRGPLPYRSGASRVWQLDVIDQNACLSFEVFRANSAQRPDETDLARIEFILESAPMAGTPVVAGTLTNLTDDPRNLQSADFVRQKPVEAFTSTAGQSGKSFYVFWNQTTERLELFYDVISAYPAATAAISNLMADEGPGVFYPFLDAELRRNGEDIYTGELLDFVGGAVYARNQTTIDRLSPTPLSPINFLRDFMRRSDQIGLVSTAEAVVADDLAGHATEEDTITVTIRVPAANVNDIEAGQRVTVTFSHLVGYETPTDVNCIKRNVVPTAGRVDMYDIYLELSNKAKLRDLDGGDPDEFPHQPCTDDGNDSFAGSVALSPGTPHPFPDEWFDEDDMTWTTSSGGSTEGWDTQVLAELDRILIKWSYGDLVPGFGAAAAFEIEGTNDPAFTSWTSVLVDADPPGTAGVIYPQDFQITYELPEPVQYRYWRFTSTSGGNNDIKTLEGFLSCQQTCPAQGQWTEWELLAEGDGVTTDFTTPCPYADGALLVRVDGMDVTLGLTETAPEDGDFSLDFAPRAAQGDAPAEQVWIKYQGR